MEDQVRFRKVVSFDLILKKFRNAVKAVGMNGARWLQVAHLRVENSSLLRRLAALNQKYTDATVDNRVLKADMETLRAKV
jgi:hypothetical protein